MKIYKLTNNIPKTYHDIGHYSNPKQGRDQPFVLDYDGNDIVTGPPNSGHDHPMFNNLNLAISGRIDHTKKQISISNWHDDMQKLDYAISILQMDYPNYAIFLLKPSYGLQRIAKIAKITKITKIATSFMNGWITPTYEFIPCDRYAHLEKLLEINLIPDNLKNLVQEGINSIEYAKDYCNDLTEKGEHPEWHYVEMTESRWEHKIYQALYQAGFLRIGTYGNTMAIEGTNINPQMMQFCKDFAENHNFIPKFEGNLR